MIEESCGGGMRDIEYRWISEGMCSHRIVGGRPSLFHVTLVFSHSTASFTPALLSIIELVSYNHLSYSLS